MLLYNPKLQTGSGKGVPQRHLPVKGNRVAGYLDKINRQMENKLQATEKEWEILNREKLNRQKNITHEYNKISPRTS